MDNFNPKWDLILDTSQIAEGQSVYARIRISKQNALDINTTYTLSSTQYLKINYSIALNGNTVQERDYNVSVGESIANLIPIGSAGTGNNKIQGTHQTILNSNSFDLSSATYMDVYFIKILCPSDGIYDSAQNVVLTLNSVQVYDTLDGQIISVNSSGIIGTTDVTLTYNNSNDYWVTPDLITHQTNMYTIGSISYGAESRIFVQAFGYSRPYSYDLDSGIAGANDPSNRVFVPAYKLVNISTSEIPNEHITGSGTILVPDNINNSTEENPVLIKDNVGNTVQSGLKFNANGQFLQTLLYDSDPIDAYCKVEIVSLKSYYNNTNTSYFAGKRFKAYQTWIAPDDVSSFVSTSIPIPGHLYELKDNSVYPYVIKTENVNGTDLLVFEEDRWNDLGYFSESLGSPIIGKQKIFRLVLNNGDSTGIDFETDSDLGVIHVGEYFGHSVYPKIIASGSDLITYTLSSSSVNDITKYNLNLSADGYITGTAYCKTADFDLNDEIPLSFIVTATAKNGTSISKEFRLRIIPGFGENYISAYLNMSTAFERNYFKCISSNQFRNYNYYRQSDNRYGIQKVPYILLKENFVNPLNTWTNIKDVKEQLLSGIIDTTNGAIIPDSTFRYVIGNYKVLTAIDNNGNEIYDVLYREMLPFGTIPHPDIDPRNYNETDYFTLSEVYGLRQNIFNILGEDVKNINQDPDDFSNRAVSVSALESISQEMVDTVPRFMSHALTGNGVKNGYRPIMIVAYLNPGDGDTLFDNLVKSSEHKNMLGDIIEVQYVNFKYFSEENGKYIEQSFAIPIPIKTLMN